MNGGDLKLHTATADDIERLMAWFPTERSIDIWGGPKFRYPFTATTFHEDVRWREMSSYCGRDVDGKMLAFGQLYERHGRINLARLVVSPQHRGQGIGKQLIELLMAKGREEFSLDEFSLYVYEDNLAARACYATVGFEESRYPEDDELASVCLYMTRPV